MSNDMNSWLVENAISVVAVVVAIVSLATSIVLARRTEIRGRKPVLLLEYSEDGWHIENVGNGPAIDILLAFRGDDTSTRFNLGIRVVYAAYITEKIQVIVGIGIYKANLVTLFGDHFLRKWSGPPTGGITF